MLAPVPPTPSAPPAPQRRIASIKPPRQLLPADDSPWLRQIRSSTLLTAEEEIKLAHIVQAGVKKRTTTNGRPAGKRRIEDEELYAATPEARAAVDVFVRSNIRYAYHVALKFSKKYHVHVDDIAQEANRGLFRAALGFDPQKRLRFLTYATYWIGAYVRRRVLDEYSLVKMGTPAWQRKNFFKGVSAAADGIEVVLSNNRDGAEAKSRPLVRDVSLSRPMFTDSTAGDSPSIEESLPGLDDTEATHAGLHLRRALRARIDDALAQMDDWRMRDVIRRRHLVDEDEAGSTHATLEVLGQEWGVSRERVRQIETRALAQLRSTFARDRGMRRLMHELNGGWYEGTENLVKSGT